MPNWPFVDDASENNFRDLADAVRAGRSTVFAGAGLSQQANLPGWRGLLDGLHTAADLVPRGFRPGRAALDFEALRVELDDDYLPTLRRLLNPPGLQLPKGYITIADIPFQRFATTNIDELLYFTAVMLDQDREGAIFEYPSRNYLGGLFYYLHGRLSSAKIGRDLVLCESDYEIAYGRNGETRQALINLLADSAPALFVGSSLDDPDLSRLFNEIERYRRTSTEIGGLREERYSPDPSWFAILPAKLERLIRPAMIEPYIPADEIPNLVQWASEELHPIRSIWYEYDVSHRGLDELLERLKTMTKTSAAGGGDRFLAHADELEGLAAAINPTQGQIDRALLLMRLPANRKHFFEYAAPAWLPILWERNELTAFEEPRKEADGNYYAAVWDAADFFVKAAHRNPSVARDIILTVNTENWSVNWSLAQSLLRLPANVIAELIPSVSAWLDSRFAAVGPMTLTLQELLARLVREEQWDAANQLFELLSRWRDVDDDPA